MDGPGERRDGQGRALLVGLALVALVLLGVTFPLSTRSLEQADTEARERAVDVTAEVLLGAIPSELASEEILGTDRRDLLERVRTKILDDGRVARVLIWTPVGDPIFSSAVADDTTSDDLAFEQAAGGVAASTVVEASSATGEFHRTFVPLKPVGGTQTYAVAQIDQRFDAIAAEATRAFRVARIVLLLVLGGAVVGIVLLSRGRGGGGTPQEGPSGGDDERIRELEERTQDAERTARGAEERLAVAERQLHEAATLDLPPSIVARLEELESQLDETSVERERSSEEARRLRETLDAKQDEFERSAELVGEANRRAEEARRQADEAETRAVQAEQRATDMEARAVQAEERATDAETARRELEERAAGDLQGARLETNALAERLAQLEATLAESEPEPVTPPPAPLERAPTTLEITLLRDERDVAIADLARARSELEAAKAELDEARSRDAPAGEAPHERS